MLVALMILEFVCGAGIGLNLGQILARRAA